MIVYFNSKNIVFSPKAIKILLFSSILYLTTPQTIYMSICLRKSIFILVLLMTFATLWTAWKIIPVIHMEMEISWRIFAVMEILIIGIFLFSGVGGICGQQTMDYTRSNAIMSDLVLKQWPVMYNENNNISVMNYYIAYFVPGAFIGKLMNSFHVAEIITFLWSVVGLNLGILLIFLVTNVVKGKTLWLFFCWAGLDCLGQILVSGTLFKGTEHLEHWASVEWTGYEHIANYQSIASGFLWGTQHYIPTIIVTFFMIYMIKQNIYKLCMLVAISLLFWTPLAAIGVIPFAMAFIIKEKGNILRFFSSADILGLFGLGVPIIFYFFAMDFDSSGGRNNYIRDIRWILDNWTILLLFIILEFGIAGYIIWKACALDSSTNKLLVATALITMTVCLFIDWGLCHDFSMRVSIIPWLVLFSFVPGILEKADLKWKKALLFYMVGASATSCTEYARMMVGVLNHPFEASRCILGENTISGWELQYQYVGQPDALFFSKMCNIDFNADDYAVSLRKRVHDYIVYSDEIWNVYYYNKELYFWSKDKSIIDAHISISLTYDDQPVQTVDFMLDDSILYGTLSRIDNLGKYKFPTSEWNKLSILLCSEKGSVSLNWSLTDFMNWEKMK